MAAEPPDLLRLRDVICHSIETDGASAHPEWTVGDSGASWGICQLQYRTAVAHGGYPKEVSPAGLFDLQVNKQVALNILTWCYVVRKRRTILGLAACYNGAAMDYPLKTDTRPAYMRLRAYAEKVEGAYKQAQR